MAGTTSTAGHQPAHGFASEPESTPPARMWAASTLDLLEKIKKELEEAENKVDPPESPTDRIAKVIPGLEDNLDAAEEHILRLLDPRQEPNLSPYAPDAYENIDILITLEEHADAALALADEALAVYRTTDPPMQGEQISAKMNTLLNTVLPGYRLAAGL